MRCRWDCLGAGRERLAPGRRARAVGVFTSLGALASPEDGTVHGPVPLFLVHVARTRATGTAGGSHPFTARPPDAPPSMLPLHLPGPTDPTHSPNHTRTHTHTTANTTHTPQNEAARLQAGLKETALQLAKAERRLDSARLARICAAGHDLQAAQVLLAALHPA